MRYSRNEFMKLHQIYMQSEQWAITRDIVIERCNWECVKCGDNYKYNHNFQVHHTSYKRWRQPLEYLDCILLCYNCHQKVHQKKNMTMNELDEYLWKELSFYAKGER